MVPTRWVVDPVGITCLLRTGSLLCVLPFRIVNQRWVRPDQRSASHAIQARYLGVLHGRHQLVQLHLRDVDHSLVRANQQIRVERGWWSIQIVFLGLLPAVKVVSALLPDAAPDRRSKTSSDFEQHLGGPRIPLINRRMSYSFVQRDQRYCHWHGNDWCYYFLWPAGVIQSSQFQRRWSWRRGRRHTRGIIETSRRCTC